MGRATGGSATLVARPPRELDDQALVAEVRHGDDAAFEALYERYRRRITAYVKGMVHDHGRAEDLTQEVFMSALRRMRETERPIAFKPWIYEIARNACIDQHRRSRRSEEVSYDVEPGLGGSDHLRLVTTEPTPDVAVETKQQLDHLCGAFGGLSQSHHEILVLRELEGLSYREIGDRMSLSRPAVESTLFRARRRLSEEYGELVSGRRCERVQAIIAAAAEGMLGARDRRRLARHVSYCETCRHHARRMGVADVELARGVGARLAALLPLPAFLRSAVSGRADAPGGSPSQTSATLVQWAGAASPAAESLAATWAKAAATVATMAALGMGAGVSSHNGAITSLTVRAGDGWHGGESVRGHSRAAPASPDGAGRLERALRDAAGRAPARAPTPPRMEADRPRAAVPPAPRRALPRPLSSAGSAEASRTRVDLPPASGRLRAEVPALRRADEGPAPPTRVAVSLSASTPVGDPQADVAAPDLVGEVSATAQPVPASAVDAAGSSTAPVLRG